MPRLHIVADARWVAHLLWTLLGNVLLTVLVVGGGVWLARGLWWGLGAALVLVALVLVGLGLLWRVIR